MRLQIQSAFTLVELLVVIAIVGILSGLIIVGMSSSVDNARIAKAQIFSSSLRDSMLANLASEWKFDGTGLNDGDTVTTSYPSYIADSWGSNSGTTITGTPKAYSGNNCVYGSCLYFDGSSNISGSSGTLIPSQTQYTVEGWIKIAAGTTGTSARYLMNLQASAGYPAFSPCYWSNYRPLIYLNGSNYRYSSSDLRDSKWHHIVFVVTGSAASDITNDNVYIDGRIDTVYSTNSTASPILPNGNFLVGSAYTGYLDTIRVYNTVIPTSEIRAHYYAGLNRLLSGQRLTKTEYIGNIDSLSIYTQN